MNGEAPKDRPIDPDDLARESLRHYDIAAAAGITPEKESEVAVDEDALLDPDRLHHEIEQSHPGSRKLRGTIDEDPADKGH